MFIFHINMSISALNFILLPQSFMYNVVPVVCEGISGNEPILIQPVENSSISAQVWKRIHPRYLVWDPVYTQISTFTCAITYAFLVFCHISLYIICVNMWYINNSLLFYHVVCQQNYFFSQNHTINLYNYLNIVKLHPSQGPFPWNRGGDRDGREIAPSTSISIGMGMGACPVEKKKPSHPQASPWFLYRKFPSKLLTQSRKRQLAVVWLTSIFYTDRNTDFQIQLVGEFLVNPRQDML